MNDANSVKDYENAIALFQKCIEEIEASNTRTELKGITLGKIGTCQFNIGKIKEAEETIQQAYEICLNEGVSRLDRIEMGLYLSIYHLN